MIKAVFSIRNGKQDAFCVTGHSGSAKKGRDIVCAAVSSAVYMTANTITEVIGCEAETQTDDGYLSLKLTDGSDAAQDIIEGLRIHLVSLSEQYPDYLTVSTEV